MKKFMFLAGLVFFGYVSGVHAAQIYKVCENGVLVEHTCNEEACPASDKEPCPKSSSAYNSVAGAKANKTNLNKLNVKSAKSASTSTK